MANPIKDLKGQVFGKLTVVEFSHSDGRSYWLCKCECGKTKTVRSSSLRRKKRPVRSCGCLVGKHKITHGLSNSKLYDVWRQMNQRCFNPFCKDYRNYGGRGIKVCKSWRNIKEFISWARSSGYKSGLTIERKDVNKDYAPSNCCWIDNKHQARNTRKVRKLTYQGVTRTVSDWADLTGINHRTLKGRLNRGWSAQKALTLKPKHGRNQHG